MATLLLFSQAFMHALLWTLVHSLWQALLAAALAGAVIVCTRQQSAALRYNLLLLVGLLFLLAASGTFQWCYQSYQSTAAITWFQDTSLPPETVYITLVGKTMGTSGNWLQPLIRFINQNASTLLVIWMLVLCAKSTVFLWHYREVWMLRRKQLQPVDGYWHHRLLNLCSALGVNRKVGFFQSGRTKVPVVVGYFKPLVLVPVGFLNNLSPEDVEAILVHELAHIRRSDYLVNLLQNLVELLFFFNLPLLWISSQIRKEREHCCDDVAVTWSGNKRSYIGALVAFQEQELANRYATAFSGHRKMPLLQRVKRLIYNNNQTLSTMEKISLSAGVLAIAFIAFAFQTKQQVQDTVPKPTLIEVDISGMPAPVPTTTLKEVVPVSKTKGPHSSATLVEQTLLQAADTSGKGRHEVNTIMNGKRYQMTLEEDKLVALSIDGVAVPESRFAEYNDLVQTILEHKAKAEAHAKVAKEHAKKAEEMAKLAETHAANAEAAQKDAAVRLKEVELHSREAVEHSKDAATRAKEAELHEVNAKEHIRQAEMHAKQAEAHAAQAKVHAREAQVHAKVYKQLVEEGLIKKGDNNVNFSMQDGKMIINGVEQSKEVYDRYQKLMTEERKKLGLQ